MSAGLQQPDLRHVIILLLQLLTLHPPYVHLLHEAVYGHGVGGLRPGPHCSLNSTSHHRDVLLLTCFLSYIFCADPAGFRVDSGNHDPTIAWSLGASLAALNWQSWDKPCWVNEAFFRDNGSCGYVKKPSWMTGGKPGDADSAGGAATGGDGDGLPQRNPRCLSVHVYSAFYPQSSLQLCCGRVGNFGLLQS